MIMKVQFSLMPLPYAYDALDPYIDARTMELHYTKHHQGYLDNLNLELEKMHGPGFLQESYSIKALTKFFAGSNAVFRYNVGGYYNHELFWEGMTPYPQQKLGVEIKHLMEKYFGGQKLHRAFTAKALSLLGPGWTWLCSDIDNKLHIINTPLQDNPFMISPKEDLVPILALDMWEHAYYLKYQNKKQEYIKAFWNVVDWEGLARRYETYYRSII